MPARDVRRLVLASRNPHKVREFERLLGPAVEIDQLPDEVQLPPENGEKFIDNARVKARVAAQATGRVAIADDSGICAEALGGAPGVRSARYAGEDADDEANLAKLLREAPAGSQLEYVCSIAYVDPESGEEEYFEATCSGRLAQEPRGTGGFGYDPAFVPDDVGDGRTMAQLEPGEKAAISHRGRAARALLDWLEGR